MDAAKKTIIGILYPGEMGSNLGKLLRDGGLRVVTTLEGRSPRTRQLCRIAGLDVLGSVGEVLDQSDFVISLVIPSSAVQVARQVAAITNHAGRRLVYVDANSISPTAVNEITQMLRDSPVDFIDAAIHGRATHLRDRAVLYLSGPRAVDLASRLEPFLRVNIVGPVLGQASALKMVLTVMSKGLVGLFVEAMIFARCLQFSDEAIEGCRFFYPGVMEAIGRILPSYPQHAPRRAEELWEIGQVMLQMGLNPQVVRGVQKTVGALALMDWKQGCAGRQWTIAEIIEEVYVRHALEITRREAPVETAHASLAELLNSLDTGKRQRDP